jgi:hypothetical protein
MVARLLAAQWIFVVSAGLATSLAGCSSSVGPGSSVGDDDQGGDDQGGDTTGDGSTGDDTGDGTGGPTCPNDPCDLYDQCGCGAGEACDLNYDKLSDGATECRTASKGQADDACSKPEDCASGYGCFGTPGQCRRFCDSDSTCGVGYCSIRVLYDAGGGNWEDVPDATLCTKACKPEAGSQSGCPGGFSCRYYLQDPDGQPSNGDEYDYSDCSAAGSGGDGASCKTHGDADCKTGFGCYNIVYDDKSVHTECRQICVVSRAGEPVENTCGAGTCHPWSDPKAMIGDVEYGVCY